jgi:hypothetical protein
VRLRWAIVPGLLLFGLAGPAGAQVATLRPVDEAARHAEFFSFRAQLLSAIARRDTGAVLAVVDPGIRISFGEEGGSADFRRQWKLDENGGHDSQLWAELGAALAFGGSFEGGDRFVAPYVFSRWPSAFDAFEHVAIVGGRVRVRAEGRADAAVIGRLDFAIVPRARVTGHGPADGPGWTPIRLRDGRTGYIASSLVRSPVDWRALFRRDASGWRLEAFVAGD